MSEQLNPCSICKSPVEKVWDLQEEVVRCTNRTCHNSLYSMPLNEWQKRPIEDILKLHIAELEKRTAELHYANTACMEMKHELDRLNAELLELNDKAVFIKFENEDELPAEIKDDVYSAMFECSHVDGVRLFPYIEENGQKYFLVMLKEVV